MNVGENIPIMEICLWQNDLDLFPGLKNDNVPGNFGTILEFCDLDKNLGRMVDLKSSTFLLSVQWLEQFSTLQFAVLIGQKGTFYSRVL